MITQIPKARQIQNNQAELPDGRDGLVASWCIHRKTSKDRDLSRSRHSRDSDYRDSPNTLCLVSLVVLVADPQAPSVMVTL